MNVITLALLPVACVVAAATNQPEICQIPALPERLKNIECHVIREFFHCADVVNLAVSI
jgi:hypothetical protein